MAWLNRKKKNSFSMKDNDTRRQERYRVYMSTQWRKLSEWKRRNDPLCEVCLMEGKTEPGTDVHHLRSFTGAKSESERYGLAYDYDNLLTVCDRCHNRLHHGDLRGCVTREGIRIKNAELRNKG